MDELPPRFRPDEVGARVGLALRIEVQVGTVLRIARAGILGIEEVLPALEVLHAEEAKAPVELAGGHPQPLGHLRGGEARDGINHLVGIIGPRLELGDPFVPPLQRLLHDAEGAREDHLVRLVGAYHHIAARLADGGKDLAAYPILKTFRLRLVRTHDHLVKVLFVDVNKPLHHFRSKLVIGRGVYRINTPLVQPLFSIAGLQFQHPANIR